MPNRLRQAAIQKELFQRHAAAVRQREHVARFPRAKNGNSPDHLIIFQRKSERGILIFFVFFCKRADGPQAERRKVHRLRQRNGPEHRRRAADKLQRVIAPPDRQAAGQIGPGSRGRIFEQGLQRPDVDKGRILRQGLTQQAAQRPALQRLAPLREAPEPLCSDLLQNL